PTFSLSPRPPQCGLLLLRLVLERGKLRLRLDPGLFAGADGVRLEILDALVGIIDLGAKFAAEIVKLLAHINLLNLCRLERTGRFAFWPSVDRRIAQPSRFKKDRSGQQPVNS